MPIEFQCIRCWEQIQVPDGAQETSAICPHCQHRQRVPGFSGPPADRRVADSEEDLAAGDAADFVAPLTDRDFQDLARRRLRIPVKGCQWLLLVALLTIGMLGLFALGSLWERGVRITDFDGLVGGAVILIFVIAFLLVTMDGLRHAGKADRLKAAWRGLVMAMMIGLVYPLLLPFALWGLMVMTNKDVERGFKR